MRIHTRAASLVLAAAVLAACADQPAAPAASAGGPRLSAATACTASPTVVAHTQSELRAAVASASWGDVIAISGTIALDSILIVTTPGITFTCAEPGAGLEFAPGYEDVLLDLWVGYITVQGLKLDAEYGFSPILAIEGFDGQPVPYVRVTGNQIECGYIYCIFAVGVPYLEITDNHFVGDETLFGVQIQGGGAPLPGGGYTGASDGVVVSRNVIENDEGYPFVYGGIRLRDGSNATITHNQVLGSWSNGIVLTNVYDSRVEHNRIDGALGHGIDFLLIAARRIAASGVSVRGNQITNSGVTGIAVRGACSNTFEGNNLGDNPVGATFAASTGDNVYRGSHEVVQDGGAFDCDLDGDIDPNVISGAQSQVLRDTLPGPPPHAAAAAARTHGGRTLPAAQ